MESELRAPGVQVADPERIWQAAQEELRFQLARPGYETWLANASLLESDGHSFSIGVPTRLARDWLTERYLPLIRETLSGLLGHECEVSITVDPAAEPARDEPPPPPVPENKPAPIESQVVSGGEAESRLNPNFTFSTFVVGNSGRFAHAACRAVADAPGKAYNPLFLYGGVGLGKTHLMHAIGQAVRQQSTQRTAKVAYITSEKFMNEMIASIQENRTHDFRMRYRTVDVLLIDDIQFLAGKDRTQEEFFHTFNALHEIQKQIVVSSDRPPKDIPTLEDRLRSRFEGGLMADIQPPDFETRLAILNTKLGSHSRLVPDEVCSFIAHKIQKNIRELEGALIRVLAHASINGQPITLEAAQRVLRDIIPQGDTPVSIETIQAAVASYYNIGLEEMKGKRRDKHIVFPRQVAMYLIREETESSLPAVGNAFGGRDHTTALHAIEKIAELTREDTRLQGDLRQIRQRFHGH